MEHSSRLKAAPPAPSTGSRGGGVPLLDLRAQYAGIRAEVRAAIDEVCDAQQFILGPQVQALEEAVAAYCGTRFAIGLSSGTDALTVGLMALGVGPGDEVITSPFTFFATAGCVARLGAKPVFVDCRPDTFNIDSERIESAITPRTRAIVPVDLFGQMAEMRSIMEVSRRRGIPVLEDAAQSIGARHHGLAAGQCAQLTTFSFFPSKNLGAFGDAGMLVTDDEALAARCRTLRMHGEGRRYYHQEIGGNFRLDALQAAVLRVKLKYLDGWSAARRENAAEYDAALAGMPLVTPRVLPHNQSIYNQYTVRIPDGRRDEVQASLTEMGVGSAIYYPVPLHLQECFAYLGRRTGEFPHSEAAAGEVLSLPIYPELSAEQKASVVAALGKALR